MCVTLAFPISFCDNGDGLLCSLIALIPGCPGRFQCLLTVTSWPALATSHARELCCDHLRCAGAPLAHRANKKGCDAVQVDGHRCPLLPSAITPVPLGPAQGPARQAQPIRGQPGSAPNAPGLPLHVPNTSHVTPGHRVWPHLCHSQLSSSDSRKQGGKKPRQEGEKRRKKGEQEGEERKKKEREG